MAFASDVALPSVHEGVSCCATATMCTIVNRSRRHGRTGARRILRLFLAGRPGESEPELPDSDVTQVESWPVEPSRHRT